VLLLLASVACNNFTPPNIPPGSQGPAPDTTLSGGPKLRSRSNTASFQISSNDPAATFLCSLDDARFSACTSPVSLTNLIPAVHVFRAYAVLSDGRFDATPASYTWEVVGTPIDTTITSGPMSPTSSTSALFAFTSPTDPDATFECALDTAAFAACTSPATLNVGDGVHTFRVRAVDSDGNRDDTPAALTWQVDTTQPAVTLVVVPTGIVEDPQFEFVFQANKERVRLFCKLDDAAYTPCSSPYTVTDLTPGVHQFAVLAEDIAGNRSAPASAGFEVRWKLGANCGLASDCHSSFCKDGVCCNEACTGTCRSCSLGRGTCAIVRNAIDIDTCSGDNACDANGFCRPGLSDPTFAGFEFSSSTHNFRGHFPAGLIEMENSNHKFQGRFELSP
jgi:hypothetical protein